MLDKENILTFHNISQTMKMAKAQKEGTCVDHPDRAAKYRSRENCLLYCTACAIQEASRGGNLQELSKKPTQSAPLSILHQIYQESQQEIQEYIRTYNVTYQKLLEAVTDLQIRDLIGFNRKL